MKRGIWILGLAIAIAVGVTQLVTACGSTSTVRFVVKGAGQ